MDLPKTFDEFVDARKQGFIRAKEFKDNGGKLAGCLCSYTPQELLDAAGVATVGLCGTSSETIPDAEKVLPKNLCPLIKSTYGFAYSEKCPYTYFSDIIIGETTCDGKKKMYELLNEIKETYVLHLPQSQERPYAKDIWYECDSVRSHVPSRPVVSGHRSRQRRNCLPSEVWRMHRPAAGKRRTDRCSPSVSTGLQPTDYRPT